MPQVPNGIRHLGVKAVFRMPNLPCNTWGTREICYKLMHLTSIPIAVQIPLFPFRPRRRLGELWQEVLVDYMSDSAGLVDRM